jgi:DNA-binding NtrC family response regulator
VAAPVAVVHNDPQLRELMIFTLRAAGHHTAGFDDPGTALEALEGDPHLRVLVTRPNFGSGKLNGVALARMLRLKRQGLKTVFVGRVENAEHVERVGEFLPLPLNPEHLAHIVASLLAEPSRLAAD